MNEMRSVVLAANNNNGLEAIKALNNMTDIFVEALIVHPEERSNHRELIISESKLSNERIFEYDKKNIELLEKKLKNEFKCDVLLSVNFGFRFTSSTLALFKYAINLHTGYLPWNKGTHPNVWPFIDGTPAGVTLHLMTPKLDEGPIIDRQIVNIGEIDTALSLYEKLETESIKLLKKALIKFLANKITPYYPNEKGTYHSHQDFLDLQKIDPNKELSCKQFISILRALSFPPYKNGYLVNESGKKVFLDILLSNEEV